MKREICRLLLKSLRNAKKVEKMDLSYHKFMMSLHPPLSFPLLLPPPPPPPLLPLPPPFPSPSPPRSLNGNIYYSVYKSGMHNSKGTGRGEQSGQRQTHPNIANH